MTNNNFNTEFLDHIVDGAAWKDISGDFHWSQSYLAKYADRVDWKEVSDNWEIAWSASMLEAFKGRIDWHELSGTGNKILFTTTNLDKFAAYWDWSELSENPHLPFTLDLLDRYADRWDWAEIIDNYGVNEAVGFNRAFLDRYKEYIPVSRIQDTILWRAMVKARKEEIAGKILSEDA